MTSITVSRNRAQKIASFGVIVRTVLQPTIYYTVPAGKKAIVKGHCSSDNTGAAANTTLEAAGEAVRRVLAVGGGLNSWNQDIAVNVGFDFEVTLAAGEFIRTIQDAGTNASWDINLDITETPA